MYLPPRFAPPSPPLLHPPLQCPPGAPPSSAKALGLGSRFAAVPDPRGALLLLRQRLLLLRQRLLLLRQRLLLRRQRRQRRLHAEDRPAVQSRRLHREVGRIFEAQRGVPPRCAAKLGVRVRWRKGGWEVRALFACVQLASNWARGKTNKGWHTPKIRAQQHATLSAPRPPGGAPPRRPAATPRPPAEQRPPPPADPAPVSFGVGGWVGVGRCRVGMGLSVE